MAGCTGITDPQYLKAAEAQGDYEINAAQTQAIISGGVLAAQILLRNYISNKTDAIRDRQLAIAETFRDQLRKFWEVDKALLSDACSKPVPETDYGIARTFLDFVGTNDCVETGIPCIVVDPCTRGSTAMALMTAKVDAANFGMRYAENRQRALDDQRFSRKFKTLQSIRGIYSGADRLIDHAGGTAGIASLASMINAGLGIAGVFSVSKQIMPEYQGRREYYWGGNSNVAATPAPFVVNVEKAPVKIEQGPTGVMDIPVIGPTGATGPRESSGATGPSGSRERYGSKGYSWGSPYQPSKNVY